MIVTCCDDEESPKNTLDGKKHGDLTFAAMSKMNEFLHQIFIEDNTDTRIKKIRSKKYTELLLNLVKQRNVNKTDYVHICEYLDGLFLDGEANNRVLVTKHESDKQLTVYTDNKEDKQSYIQSLKAIADQIKNVSSTQNANSLVLKNFSKRDGSIRTEDIGKIFTTENDDIQYAFIDCNFNKNVYFTTSESSNFIIDKYGKKYDLDQWCNNIPNNDYLLVPFIPLKMRNSQQSHFIYLGKFIEDDDTIKYSKENLSLRYGLSLMLSFFYAKIRSEQEIQKANEKQNESQPINEWLLPICIDNDDNWKYVNDDRMLNSLNFMFSCNPSLNTNTAINALKVHNSNVINIMKTFCEDPTINKRGGCVITVKNTKKLVIVSRSNVNTSIHEILTFKGDDTLKYLKQPGAKDVFVTFVIVARLSQGASQKESSKDFTDDFEGINKNNNDQLKKVDNEIQSLSNNNTDGKNSKKIEEYQKHKQILEDFNKNVINYSISRITSTGHDKTKKISKVDGNGVEVEYFNMKDENVAGYIIDDNGKVDTIQQ